jgi:hypothetical protein
VIHNTSVGKGSANKAVNDLRSVTICDHLEEWRNIGRRGCVKMAAAQKGPNTTFKFTLVR